MRIYLWIKKYYKTIWKKLKPFILVGALVVFFFQVPIGKIWDAIRAADLALFGVSFLISFFALYLGTLKLWFFTKNQGLEFRTTRIFTVSLAVRFYSFFSPASIVGSGLKWYKLSSPGKESATLLAITLSRIWDVFLAVFFGLLWMLMGTNVDFVPVGFLITIIVVIITLWLIALRYSVFFSAWFAEKAGAKSAGLLKKLYSFVTKLFHSFSVYKKMSLSTWMLLVGISILAELVALVGHTILAHALNIPVSFVDLGWMRSIFLLSALAPFTLAGGIGLREVSVVFVMSSFGIPTELAVAYSFLMYARSVLLSLSGGLVELFSVLGDVK